MFTGRGGGRSHAGFDGADSNEYREKEFQREKKGSSQDLATFIISIINNRNVRGRQVINVAVGGMRSPPARE